MLKIITFEIENVRKYDYVASVHFSKRVAPKHGSEEPKASGRKMSRVMDGMFSGTVDASDSDDDAPEEEPITDEPTKPRETSLEGSDSFQWGITSGYQAMNREKAELQHAQTQRAIELLRDLDVSYNAFHRVRIIERRVPFTNPSAQVIEAIRIHFFLIGMPTIMVHKASPGWANKHPELTEDKVIHLYFFQTHLGYGNMNFTVNIQNAFTAYINVTCEEKKIMNAVDSRINQTIPLKKVQAILKNVKNTLEKGILRYCFLKNTGTLQNHSGKARCYVTTLSAKLEKVRQNRGEVLEWNLVGTVIMAEMIHRVSNGSETEVEEQLEGIIINAIMSRLKKMRDSVGKEPEETIKEEL